MLCLDRIDLICIVLTAQQGDMLKMIESVVSLSVGSKECCVWWGGGFPVTYENIYFDFQENFRLCVTCTLLFVTRARRL